MRRVVVTGMGIWSCIGTNLIEVAENLRKGKNGIVSDSARTEYGMHCPLVGNVPKPNLRAQLPDRRARFSMSEEAEYAYMAARQAFDQACITDDYLRKNEVGILFGNDSSVLATVEAHNVMLANHDTAAIGSGHLFRAEGSTVSMNLSAVFHLRGINATLSAACASGGHSVGIGTMFIRQGLQDMILVGGAQEANMIAVEAFEAIGAFAQNIDPDTACCPFDQNRSGLIPSGGAAALVLEEYEHAVARGATILAEVAGYGFSSNGLSISEPSRDGAMRSMLRALHDAGMQPNAIDYINAHATSTQAGDIEEAVAVTELFGEHQPLISSTKSMTGHECWMAGASELVYSILMMQHGFVAPNIHLKMVDASAAKLRLVKTSVSTQLNTIMSNSFGFGGTNSTIIIKRL